jgi:hypothetical protein
MLTDAEASLLADAFLLRNAEHDDQQLWFAVRDDLLPECHRLVHDRGYLDRRWHGDDLVYRYSDTATTAMGLSALVAPDAITSN